MRVLALGCTLPWQLLAAHPPGPLYLPAATAFWSYGGVAIAGLDPAFCATLRESGMSSGKTTASSCFRILLSLLTSRSCLPRDPLTNTPGVIFAGVLVIRRVREEINREHEASSKHEVSNRGGHRGQPQSARRTTLMVYVLQFLPCASDLARYARDGSCLANHIWTLRELVDLLDTPNLIVV